jgi:hypothetical protein
MNLRMMMTHYGSYAACPRTLTATLLEVDDYVQCDLIRRRMKVLSHLPLNGSFKLCEVSLSELLPPESLEPFAEEMRQRQRRRSHRTKQEARQQQREAVAAAAAEAAALHTGLTSEELRAMPLPSASRGLLAEDAYEYPIEDDSADGSFGESAFSSFSAPRDAPSFARITQLGFAATGPALGTSGDAAAQSSAEAFPALGMGPAVAPSGAWAARRGGAATSSLAQQLSAMQMAGQDNAGDAGGGGKKAGSKGKVLLTTTKRRY